MSTSRGKKYPKPPATQRMSTGVYQPLTIKEFTLFHMTQDHSLEYLFMIVARLLAVLVGRRVLNAPDFYYVITGTWHETVSFSDWTPEQELEEGLQNGVILER